MLTASRDGRPTTISRTPSLPTISRNCEKPATCASPCRRNWEASACARGRRARAASPRQPCAGNRARHQHALVLDRRRRRPVARRRQVTAVVARGGRRGRCLPRATPKAATTFRCCSRPRRPTAWTAATGLPAASRSAACRRSGPTWACTAWTPPTQPAEIVHAFMPRDTEGYRIEETWDVLGMRATRSDDTILDGAFVPDRFVARVVPAGAAGIDAFVLGLFAWALLGFGNIYYGLARRALDLTLAVGGDEAIGRVVEADVVPRRVSASHRGNGAGHGGHWPASRSHCDDWSTGSITGGRGRRRSSPPSTTPWKVRGASPISRSSWPAVSASSGETRSSGSSGMLDSAGSIPPTRC